MLKYPPILIIVYDRYSHFKRCITALQNCVDAKYYSVFVASDGPRDVLAKQRIEKIRRYCETVQGFTEFRVLKRDQNVGLLANSIAARDYLFELDERLIVIEDDVVVGKYFLRYMTEGLNKFQENKNIVGICSQLPVEFDQKFSEPFFWSLRAPYGLGMWQRGERYIAEILSSDPTNYFKSLISSRKRMKRLLTSYPYLLKPIILIASGQFRAPDVEAAVVMIEYDLLALYPHISLTNHMGNDGTGLHAPKDEYLQSRPISHEPESLPPSMQIEQHKDTLLENHFYSKSWKYRMIFELVYWSLKIVPKLPLILFYIRNIKKRVQKSYW